MVPTPIRSFARTVKRFAPPRATVVLGIGAASVVLAFAYSLHGQPLPLAERTFIVGLDRSNWQQDRVLIVSAASGSMRQVGTPDIYNEAAWSPDGQMIAAVGARLHLINASSGAEKIVDVSNFPDFVDWAPDGSALAVSGSLGGEITTSSRLATSSVTSPFPHPVTSAPAGRLIRVFSPLMRMAHLRYASQITA
jgi:hypothetical protein